MWLLASVSLWSSREKVNVSVPMLCDTSTAGHKKCSRASKDDCGSTQLDVQGWLHLPHQLQWMAPKLSPGYGRELLTRLSLKKCNLLRPSCTNSNTASFETRIRYLINLCWISCSPKSLLQMDVLHIEWRVNGLESTVSPHLQAVFNYLMLWYFSSCFCPEMCRINLMD